MKKKIIMVRQWTGMVILVYTGLNERVNHRIDRVVFHIFEISF